MESRAKEIVPKLPNLHEHGESLPSDLFGATLLQIGTAANDTDSGELIIEYKPLNQSTPRRLVLLFDDRGMWIDQNASR